MDLQINKDKLKEFFSEKMNRRQLIISGIIVVLGNIEYYRFYTAIPLCGISWNWRLNFY